MKAKRTLTGLARRAVWASQAEPVEPAREEPGKENAAERYERLWGEGASTGWAGFCTVPDYCTSPCTDCAAMGARVDEAHRRAEGRVL